MPIICIANSKGTGKTMVSLNLIPHLKPDRIIDLEIHGGGLSDINRLGGSLEVLHTKSQKELEAWFDDDDQLILVDTGGFDLTLNRYALSQADFILSPTSDDPTDQLRLKDFNRTMKEVSKSVGEHLTAYALLNRVHPNRRSFDDFDELISGLDHVERLPNIIPQSVSLPKAAFKGQPMKSGSIAANFAKLAKDIKMKL